MKSFATITKSILTHTLTLGIMYAYGVPPLFNHDQIECGKNNKKNKPALIFVSEGNYIFNDGQLHDIAKDSSPVSMKAEETKTGKILFVSEETILYNPQHIFIGPEKKTNSNKIKIIAKKSYKKPLKINKNEPVKSINISFSWNNGQNLFVLASGDKSCACSTHNDHHKQLINANRFSLHSFVFSKDELSEYNTHMVSCYNTIIFSIRPPPSKNIYHNSI
ncbi:hypothetical protein N0B40_05700 [Chryseobacterium oranimense]|uniref:hypothetical protein n=1 Tax=Chryseobacterium oranimense TaxID=421058 RepID=UPI0021AEC12A|nr:hypothetical protein [Chryseobacterium oranimense]UWX61773.1 hypothetical protein N0B40_05700 [Chryseobacterium oranimense]